MTMNIKLLGDVHLGKRWKTNVPLHRRGEREALQWAEFEQNLLDMDDYDIHVQVGDLFDEAVVPFGTIYRAARAYQRATQANPEKTYLLYRGNHDANRDVEKVTAFQIFSVMLLGMAPGVEVAQDRPHLFDGGGKHVLIPWHPVHTAAEMVDMYENMIRDADVVYGHWDVDRRQTESTNYTPAEKLAAMGVKRIVTGHDHLRREETLAGIPVFVTGSMQPYDHSQDPDERLYVTRTLSQVLESPDGFRDKHLRIVLQPGQTLDVPIDCLQLTLIREGEIEERVDLDVEFEVFDFKSLLEESIVEVGLEGSVADAMRNKLEELSLHDDDQTV